LGSILLFNWLNQYTAKLGYKQELRRNFTTIEVFGIAFSIMGLLPSIASTLAYSIPAGPVGMVWVRKMERRRARSYTLICSDKAGIGMVFAFNANIFRWVGHGRLR
jgi:hypothetical protein